MATLTNALFACCLVMLVSLDLSQALKMSITEHLTKNCQGFAKKKMDEGYLCNSEVIDHVHDHAESINLPGYDGDLVEDFLDLANMGSLCYAEGGQVLKVKNACTAMEMVCDAINPRTIDICTKVTPGPATQAPATAATTTAAPAPTTAGTTAQPPTSA